MVRNLQLDWSYPIFACGPCCAVCIFFFFGTSLRELRFTTFTEVIGLAKPFCCVVLARTFAPWTLNVIDFHSPIASHAQR